MKFPTPWVAGGGAITLLSFAAFLTWRLVRLLNAQIDRDLDIRAAHETCLRRLSLLVDIAMQHGWEFPDNFWLEERDDDDAKHK